MTDQLPMLAASTVAICLLLAASHLVLAARGICSGATLAFSAGFGAFALAAAITLAAGRATGIAPITALMTHGASAVAVAALWSGFWLRGERRLRWWFPCTAVLLWMLPLLADQMALLSAPIPAALAAAVISMAVGSSVWCMYRKRRQRNAADYALILWLLLLLPLPPLAVYIDSAAATTGILWVRAPIVPTVLLGIGLFTLLAVTLDAITDSADLAYSDALTGLHNRRAFDAELELAVARAERYQRDLSLLVVDIDEFKRLNDTHGHPAGDAVIRIVSRALVENARRIDIVARIGGEEFGLILADTPSSAALRLAERMRQAIGKAGHEHISVSASFGVATLGGRSRTAQTLLQAADGALYSAKQAGRNRVRFAGDPHQEVDDLIAPAGA